MSLGAGSWSENCRVTSTSLPGAIGELLVTQYTFVARWVPSGSGNSATGLTSIVTGDRSAGGTNAPGADDTAARPSCGKMLPRSTEPLLAPRADPRPPRGCWVGDLNWGGGGTPRGRGGGATPP